MMASAWKKVKQTTIQNCFRRAFASESSDGIDSLQDVPVLRDMSRENFEMILEVEEEALPDEDDLAEDDEDSGEEEGDPVPPKISAKECLNALATVRIYSQGRGLQCHPGSQAHRERLSGLCF